MREAETAASMLWSEFHLPGPVSAKSSLGLVAGGARQITRRNAVKVVWEIENIADLGGVRGHLRSSLFRDIVGPLPFRPVTFSPAWLTSAAVGIATGIYDDRAFDRLPILADALQDAGCEDADILAHCRGDGPHARGCWVVDRVLGKE
ncbi:hypothetical protein [Limnoglobus roseus]|nr:hypothetical protein [Limnoglobus roseus]